MNEIKVKVYAASYSDWTKMIYLGYRKNKPEIFIGMFGFVLTCVTCFVVSFLLYVSNRDSSQTYVLIVIGAICLCIFLDFDRRIRNDAKIMYKETTKENYPCRFIISEVGFRKEDEHQNNYKKWTDFNRYIISKNYILLFNNDEIVYFLSQNYSIEQFEMIKDWVKKQR